MSKTFGGLAEVKEPLELSGGGLVIDGDTIYKDGEKYRLPGIDAPEIESMDQDSFNVKRADLGGMSTAEAVQAIINENNFNEPETTGSESGDRIVADFKNPEGAYLTDTLIAAGIVRPTKFTPEDLVEKYELGRAARELGVGEDPYQQFRETIEADERSLGLRFKPLALDELEYSMLGEEASRYYGGVQFRRDDRTLDNKSLNPLSDSWFTGWQGALEGAYGGAEAFGTLIGWDDWRDYFENLGIEKRAEIGEAPKLLVDYKDVKSIGGAFEYLGNNFVMSVPYLALLAGGTLLSPVTGGASAVIGYGGVFATYAGQTWNEMEGEKGRAQATAAFASAGVQTLLDRLGLKGLIKPTEFITAAGKEKAITTLMAGQAKTGGRAIPAMSREAAEQFIETSTKRTIKDIIEHTAEFSVDQIRKGGIARQVANRAIRGFATEGLTEAGQETASYLTAVAASDKIFDSDEYLNRVINAGIAGGAIGTGFGAAGGVWDIGDTLAYRRSLEKRVMESANEFQQMAIEAEEKGQGYGNVDEVIIKPLESLGFDNKESIVLNELDDQIFSREDILAVGDLDTDQLKDIARGDLINPIKKEIASLRQAANEFANRGESQLESRTLKRIHEREMDLYKEETRKTQADLELQARKNGTRSQLNPDEYRDMQREVDQLKQTRAKVQQEKDPFMNLNLEAAKYKENNKFSDTLKQLQDIPDAIGKVGRGIRKFVDSASFRYFKPDVVKRIPAFGKIRALLGQARGKLYTGRSFELYYDKLFGDFRNMYNSKKITVSLGFPLTHKGYAAATSLLREFGSGGYFNRIKEGQSIDDAPQRIKDKRSELFAAAKELETYTETLWNAQDKAMAADHKGSLGKVEGWWWKHQSFDPKKVKANKEKWFAFMEANTEFNDEQLKAMFDRIVGDEATTIEGALSLLESTTFQPNSHKQRTANLSEKKGWADFAEENMFNTMNDEAKYAARYITNIKYFGKDNWKLTALFEQARQEGATPEEIQEAAWVTLSIIQAANGEFNRIQNERVAAVQRIATFVSTIAGLPLSAISSIPEFMMILLGITSNDQIIKATNTLSMNLINSVKRGMTGIIEHGIRRGTLRRLPSEASLDIPVEQQRVDRTGLIFDEDGGLVRVGVDRNNVIYRSVLERFFRAIGLTTVTQIQRRVAASFGLDIIVDHVDTLSRRVEGQPMTQAQMESFIILNDLGIDVNRLVEIYNDYNFKSNDIDLLSENSPDNPLNQQQMQEVYDIVSTGLINFIDERVQNPRAFNRPLLFQDPRFAMFTQFNGFISVFTANIVPKLWDDYVRRGSPRMKYNAFALMVTMVGMGMASQYLKDLIKFGEASPYLNTPKKLQRAIYSSGLLGQGERVVDAVIPLYESRTRGPFDWMLNTLQGEAGPTVQGIGSLYEAGTAFGKGETTRGVDKLLRLTPASTFTDLRKELARQITGAEEN